LPIKILEYVFTFTLVAEEVLEVNLFSFKVIFKIAGAVPV
jgi:hypothetical protein